MTILPHNTRFPLTLSLTQIRSSFAARFLLLPKMQGRAHTFVRGGAVGGGGGGEEERLVIMLFLVTCVARADLVLRGLADIRARADTDGVLGACRVDEEDRGL